MGVYNVRRAHREYVKEAGHEQWLAAPRNNVVFVGSFYLPAAQECSLQSASKFKTVAQLAIVLCALNSILSFPIFQ